MINATGTSKPPPIRQAGNLAGSWFTPFKVWTSARLSAAKIINERLLIRSGAELPQGLGPIRKLPTKLFVATLVQRVRSPRLAFSGRSCSDCGFGFQQGFVLHD